MPLHDLPRSTGRVVLPGVAACLVLAVPGAAWAHGVSGGADSVGGFLSLGFRHMLLGWDHLLFIGGVLLLASELERGIKLLSVFALGHSITLITATVAGWWVPPVVVDTVIAASLACIGVVGLFGRPERWRAFGIMVLLFGLVHGLGLAARLQEPGLAEHLSIARLLAFNVGVELAQLFGGAAALLVGLAVHAAVQRRFTWPTIWTTAHAALVVVGLVASTVLATTAGPAEPPA
jgi:hydrogenase/urease accessory protein HupE